MKLPRALSGEELAVLLSRHSGHRIARTRHARSPMPDLHGTRSIQNARIEHDKAPKRAMTELLADHTELFKQFSDNESFRRWLAETVFAATYSGAGPAGAPAQQQLFAE